MKNLSKYMIYLFPIPLTIPLVAISLFLKEQKNGLDCSDVEYIFQEASQCLSRPNSWERWSELKEAHGLEEGVGPADATNCPRYISQAEEIGMPIEGLVEFGNLQFQENTGVKPLWRKYLKIEFCEYAEKKGWTTT